MNRTVVVDVPATTANVGPGFDTLGIALRLYNRVSVELSVRSQIELRDAAGAVASPGSIQMAAAAAHEFFRRAKLKKRGVTIFVTGAVPVARGLGSSVTLRLGIVAGLNHLLGKPLSREEILEVVTRLEGHPDNAAAALHGGLVVSGLVGTRVVCEHKQLPQALKFVAAIPDFEIETKKARALLPSAVPFADAVHNLNRSTLLTAALWDGDYKRVGDLLEDRLHQPYRAKLVPQLFPCLAAARRAGAIGGWLSGSGSTVMALTLRNPRRVGAAMKRVFEKSGASCRVLVLEADRSGVRVNSRR